MADWRLRRLVLGRWIAPLALAGAAAGAADLDPSDSSRWLLPLPDLYAIDARGSSAWAVGYWGSVLRSDDAGETWTPVATPVERALYAVSFADESHGWAVGEAGALLGSEDGGRSWTSLRLELSDPLDGRPLAQLPNLFGVAAVSATEVWVVGDFGTVLHSRNGRRFDPVVIPPETLADENIPERIFNAVRFVDRLRGWIAGEFGTLLRTSDGGATWIGERELQGAIDDVYLFDLAANGDGWAIAGGVGGVVLESDDGGSSWRALPAITRAGIFGTALRGAHGILAGDRGVLWVSTDRGETWREPSRPRSFNWLRGVAFGGKDLAYAVGEQGLILRSRDGGQSWEWRHGRQPPPKSGVSVPDPAPRTRPTVAEHGPDAERPARN
jgi:photosystem II stability/assembly factor-like uncharacterized protein